MKQETKHKLITAIVAVLMFVVAVIFTDGYNDSWKDWFAVLYPLDIAWLYLRLVAGFTFKGDE